MGRLYQQSGVLNLLRREWFLLLLTVWQFVSGRQVFPPQLNDARIRDAVRTFFLSPSDYAATYGNIAEWNTSEVTDMNLLFSFRSTFNEPIGSWDTNKVTDMSEMFNSAAAFNQPLDSWDTRNVIDMSFMFSNATEFNQPIDLWNVSKVTSMRGMFKHAKLFNQPIGCWAVRSVTDTTSMFLDSFAFSHPLCWDNIPANIQGSDGSSTTAGANAKKPPDCTCSAAQTTSASPSFPPTTRVQGLDEMTVLIVGSCSGALLIFAALYLLFFGCGKNSKGNADKHPARGRETGGITPIFASISGITNRSSSSSFVGDNVKVVLPSPGKTSDYRAKQKLSIVKVRLRQDIENLPELPAAASVHIPSVSDENKAAQGAQGKQQRKRGFYSWKWRPSTRISKLVLNS